MNRHERAMLDEWITGADDPAPDPLDDATASEPNYDDRPALDREEENVVVALLEASTRIAEHERAEQLAKRNKADLEEQIETVRSRYVVQSADGKTDAIRAAMVRQLLDDDIDVAEIAAAIRTDETVIAEHRRDREKEERDYKVQIEHLRYLTARATSRQ